MGLSQIFLFANYFFTEIPWIPQGADMFKSTWEYSHLFRLPWQYSPCAFEAGSNKFCLSIPHSMAHLIATTNHFVVLYELDPLSECRKFNQIQFSKRQINHICTNKSNICCQSIRTPFLKRCECIQSGKLIWKHRWATLTSLIEWNNRPEFWSMEPSFYLAASDSHFFYWLCTNSIEVCISSQISDDIT